ncbi:tautomerase family protein [Embleya scabrispora]|uniref:tautomerase family protein n=1 Tax=Embleya scabrispora TaxID=159449 RepID=UPI0003621D15|nr:tautomerase family protein [Embleya scabrispora]MYS79208.1 4-oxalocrotonate tautomerase [Streptomyces sp. SID5474]
MPILMLYLGDDIADRRRYEQLLTRASRVIADTLETPIDRTRVFIHTHPGRAAVGGRPLAPGEIGAPFFVCHVSSHRPPEQRTALLARLTDVIEESLDVDRSVIRGWAQPTEPDSWAVAGVPLSIARADEVGRAEKGD